MAQVLVMGLILFGLVVMRVDVIPRPRAHLFPASRRARLRRLPSPKRGRWPRDSSSGIDGGPVGHRPNRQRRR